MKAATSREFQRRFANLSRKLRAGESIIITKHGRPLGVFTKAFKPRRAPDYLANLEKPGYSIHTGQRLIEEILGTNLG